MSLEEANQSLQDVCAVTIMVMEYLREEGKQNGEAYNRWNACKRTGRHYNINCSRFSRNPGSSPLLFKGINEIGACRVCVVEVEGETGLVAACEAKAAGNGSLHEFTKGS